MTSGCLKSILWSVAIRSKAVFHEVVGATGVGRDLKILRAACRRATIDRTATGTFLLATDPPAA